MTDDVELLRRYAETHSQDSFAELVQRHLNFVYGAALRRLGGNTHRAEEIAQTVFTDLARKAAKLSDHPSITGWLHTSTRLAAAAIMRSEQRRQIREQEALTMSEAISNSPLVPDWEQLRPVIDDALDQLSERDRTAVLQRYFENQPLAKVGQTLAVSEDTARKRVDRALEKLRAQLARRGVASTSTALGLALANNIAVAAPTSLVQTVVSSSAQTTPIVASATATLASFMATSKTATFAVAIAAATSLGFATFESRATQTARYNLEQSRNELASLEKQMKEAEAKSSTTKQVSSTPRSPTFDEIARAERERGTQFLAAHPEVEEALKRSLRARIKGRFLPLYHRLHLSETQIDEFEKLMQTSIGMGWPSAGTLWIGEEMRPETRNGRIKAILGEKGFVHFQALNFDGHGGLVAQQMARSLALTDQPLTPAQGNSVEEIIEKARALTSDDGDFWPTSLPELQTVLTPQQLEDVAYVYLNEQYRKAESAALKTKSSAVPIK